MKIQDFIDFIDCNDTINKNLELNVIYIDKNNNNIKLIIDRINYNLSYKNKADNDIKEFDICCITEKKGVNT